MLMIALALLLQDVLAVETSTLKEVPYFRSILLLLLFLHMIHTMATPCWSTPPPPPTCRDGGPPAPRSPSRVTAVQRQAVRLSSLSQVSTLGIGEEGVWGQCADDGWPPNRDGGHCLTAAAAAATSNCLLLPLLLLQCRGASRQEETVLREALDKKLVARGRPGLCLTWARCRLGIRAASTYFRCGRGSFRAQNTQKTLFSL